MPAHIASYTTAYDATASAAGKDGILGSLMRAATALLDCNWWRGIDSDRTSQARVFLLEARKQKGIIERLKAGTVISFPSLNRTASVFVRRCFKPLLCDVLSVHVMRADSLPGAVLTGTPGAGKSTVAVLAVYVALSEGRDVAFWNGQKIVGHVFCGDKATTFRDHSSFLRAARRYVKDGGLFVYDTYEPPEFEGRQVLLVTAPKYAAWKEFRKIHEKHALGNHHPPLYVFPTLDAAEMSDFAAKMYPALRTSLGSGWRAAYAFMGGVPRNVFDDAFRTPTTPSAGKLLADIVAAFENGLERVAGEASCRVPDQLVHFRTLGQASQAGYVAGAAACRALSDPRYYSFHDVVYASDAAREAVEAAAAEATDAELAEAAHAAMRSETLRGLADSWFEQLARRRLAAGVGMADSSQSRLIGVPLTSAGVSVVSDGGPQQAGARKLKTSGRPAAHQRGRASSAARTGSAGSNKKV